MIFFFVCSTDVCPSWGRRGLALWRKDLKVLRTFSFIIIRDSKESSWNCLNGKLNSRDQTHFELNLESLRCEKGKSTTPLKAYKISCDINKIFLFVSLRSKLYLLIYLEASNSKDLGCSTCNNGFIQSGNWRLWILEGVNRTLKSLRRARIWDPGRWFVKNRRQSSQYHYPKCRDRKQLSDTDWHPQFEIPQQLVICVMIFQYFAIWIFKTGISFSIAVVDHFCVWIHNSWNFI